jgi:hypothetical protein
MHMHVYIIFSPYSPSYPLFPLLFLLLTPTDTQPSCYLFLKMWYFYLFKIAIQGVSLWPFHVYMYCNPNCFICSIFLLSTLVPFLWWLQQV